VTTCLLDVNVLIALAHEDHDFHAKSRAWFRQEKARTWATCPFTEAGFVRVLSNPGYQDPSFDLADAVAMLASLRKLPGHRFWGADFGLEEAIVPVASRLFGHQQVTDVYLLSLAIRNHGKVVTFDRGLGFLAGEEFAERVIRL
jgi:toxin-antitoxin system PIN domain toxin